MPTPMGDIEVSVRDGRVTVKGNGGEGTLYWRGTTVAIEPNATITIPE